MRKYLIGLLFCLLIPLDVKVAIVHAQSTPSTAINPAVFFPWSVDVINQSHGTYSPSDIDNNVSHFDVFSPMGVYQDLDFVSSDCPGLNSWQCIQKPGRNPYAQFYTYFDIASETPNDTLIPGTQSFNDLVNNHGIGTLIGAWSSMTTYAVGQAVTYNGQRYISLQSSNTNHQPDVSTTFWGDTWFAVGILHGGYVWTNRSGNVSTAVYMDMNNTNWLNYFTTNATLTALSGRPNPYHAGNFQTSGMTGIFTDNSGYNSGWPSWADQADTTTDCPIIYVSTGCSAGSPDNWGVLSNTYFNKLLAFQNQLAAAGTYVMPNWTFGGYIPARWQALDNLPNTPPFADNECLGVCAFGDPVGNGDNSGGYTAEFNTMLNMQHVKPQFGNMVWTTGGAGDGCITLTNQAPPLQITCKQLLAFEIGRFLQGYDPARRNGTFEWSYTDGVPRFPNAYYYTNFHLGYQKTSGPTLIRAVADGIHTNGDSGVWQTCFTDGCVIINTSSNGTNAVPTPSGSMRVCALASVETCDSAASVTSFDMGRTSAYVALYPGKSITNSDNPPPAGGTLAITTASFPNGTVSSSYSLTLSGSGGTAPYTWTISSGALPTGLSLASSTGIVSGTPTTAATYNFTVMLADSAASTPATRAYSMVVDAAPPPVTGSVSDAFTSAAMTQCLSDYSANWLDTTALGPTDCVRVDATAKNIFGYPQAYTGNFTGLVARWNGTFAADQSAQISISAMPANSSDGAQFVGVCVRCQGSSSTRSLYLSVVYKIGTTQYTVIGKLVSGTFTTLNSITSETWVANDTIKLVVTGSSLNLFHNGTLIPSLATTDTSIGSGGSPGVVFLGGTSAVAAGDNFVGTGTFGITTSSLPSGIVSTSYSQTLAETGGTGPFTWSITSGSLPAGLSLNSSTGAITGTPTTATTYNFTVHLVDSLSATSDKDLSILITAGPISVSTTSLSNGQVGVSYSQTLSAAGGVTPYTWDTTVGTICDGLTLATTGVISGTPTTPQTCTVTYRATDAAMNTATKSLGITIDPNLHISNLPVPFGDTRFAYSYTLTCAGGTPPCTYAVTSGTINTGLTLHSSGLIDGTPAGAGTSNFTVTVTDSNAVTTPTPMPLTVSTTTSGTGFIRATANGVFIRQIVPTTGVAPFVWTLNSGTMPAGMSITANTGALGGLITGKGYYSFTIRITDSLSATEDVPLQMIFDYGGGHRP